jgi:alkaline phosphatase D
MRTCVTALAACLVLGSGSFPGAIGQERPLTRIAFGSCADQNKPCPAWQQITARKPDLLILLGDTIYADLVDGKLVPAQPDRIARCYQELSALPAWKALRAACPLMATWDDHDYGMNDAGAEYKFREESQKHFLDFLGVPSDSPRRQRKGVYHAEIFGPPGRRVQVIVLDTRYHRSPLLKGSRGPVPGYSGQLTPYLPTSESSATILGEEQWKWLEEQFRRPAELRLIGSSIQLIAEEHPFEKWANIPAERERFFRLLRDTRASGVVILSGDRHHGELSLTTDAVGYPLYDLTSSGLNQSAKTWRAPEKNRHRVAAMPYGDNFGLITIDWTPTDPVVSLQLRDLDGEIVLKQTFPLGLLRSRQSEDVKRPAGVIGPEEAGKKIGECVVVQMRVQGGRSFKERILLNSEKDYRNERNLTVVVNQKALTGRYANADYDSFKDRIIRVTGTVTTFKDAPQIQVDDARDLEIIVDKADR